jgi:hypothetical protein
MVVVNEMNGCTEAGNMLPALNGELISLQTEKVEIVDRSTGTKVIMLTDGRTG